MLTIKSLVFSILLVGAVHAQEPTDDSKHNCCLHIKNASDAWWLTNPDITEEVCKQFKDDAKFDGETCNGDTIDDADWKSKCKVYGTSLGWTDERVGAGHNGTCYPIDN
ncbi:unnamed protein product [Fusarium graminearum]|uniref:Ecp2 effector protein domain-containing protein n=1 Tax=Gibberella zeae TaxID=5518 RepID=A0A9N8RJH3_GIBZA|nr:unnamed protein product [Fusarium graminearum]